MGKYDFSDLGDQIMEQVQKAIESVDYKRLNEDISKTVGTAIDEVKKSLRIVQDERKNEEDFYEYKDYREVGGSHQEKEAYQKERSPEQREEFRKRKDFNQEVKKDENKTIKESHSYQQQQEQSCPFPTKKVGGVAGVLMTVFGSIGLFSFALPSLICSIGWMIGEIDGADYAMTMAVMVPFLIASAVLFGRGLYLDFRISRLKKYMRRIGNKTVCSVEELSKMIEKSDEYVVKDLRRMINVGIFPEGHMDDNQKCFILDHKTYQYYLESKHQLEKRIREEELDEQNGMDDVKSEEFRLVIETGKKYVNQIRQVNDALPDPEISQKLDYMEKIISQIFTCIEMHPDKLPEIKKFLDYYMPTTLKLVQAYKNLEHEPIQSENIISSKQEIRQILDTINEAFANLLDSLYHDMAMDISADISVLKTMLAQEGLTGNDFGKKINLD